MKSGKFSPREHKGARQDEGLDYMRVKGHSCHGMVRRGIFISSKDTGRRERKCVRVEQSGTDTRMGQEGNSCANISRKDSANRAGAGVAGIARAAAGKIDRERKRSDR